MQLKLKNWVLLSWFFVDDLNHLHRGGRVSKLVAAAGSVLNIKPVMHCDAEGKLTAVGKARGANGAIKALIGKMKELCVSHDKKGHFPAYFRSNGTTFSRMW